MSQANSLDLFARFIEKELGIVYSKNNQFQLQNRLEEIAKILGTNVDGLHQLAAKGITGHLAQLLLDFATNNETSFFRDPKVFRAIAEKIVPAFHQKNPAVPMRIWSAACSFGQEPYTLAMICHQYQEKNPTFSWEIVCTDCSERALDRARKGTFSQLEIQRGLPAALLVKYFTKGADDYWTVKPVLQQNTRYFKQNLLDPMESLGRFDLVLCRNVLIYQRVESKAKVVERIRTMLSKDGCLILGAGESLLGIVETYQHLDFEGVVVYRPKPQAQQQAA